MPKLNGLPIALLSLVTAATLVSSPALAEEKYGPGVTDAEIKLGQTMPYSGPLSAYATIGRAEAAYIAMVNDQGGINGRKIKLISLDDSFSPPKTVEQTRKRTRCEARKVVGSHPGVRGRAGPPIRVPHSGERTG